MRSPYCFFKQREAGFVDVWSWKASPMAVELEVGVGVGGPSKEGSAWYRGPAAADETDLQRVILAREGRPPGNCDRACSVPAGGAGAAVFRKLRRVASDGMEFLARNGKRSVFLGRRSYGRDRYAGTASAISGPGGWPRAKRKLYYGPIR